ncbi:uncharacterized protein V1513DRAFT_444557 [Lipomyces chichibuensis]|uniref:uncharacterized protein n=1 Tax=Lipomyces chichibuensis TaxID=1546026 RepID=UPI0033434C99
MLLVDGEKYACIRCIRGHRSSTCKHKERPLVQVRKRGRPASDCNHRLAVLPDGTCECGVAAIILPKGSSGPEFREVEGGKRQILDTSEDKYESESNLAPIEPSCCGGVHQYEKKIIQFHIGDHGIVSESPRPPKVPRVIYDHSRVVVRDVPAQPASQAGLVCDSSIQQARTDTSCCRGQADCEEVIPMSTSSVSASLSSSSSTSISSISSESESKLRNPVKLRSIILKSDMNSPAIVRPFDDFLYQQTPSMQPDNFCAKDVTQRPIYQRSESIVSAESLDTDTDYSHSSPTIILDQALYSLESYLATSQRETNSRQEYALHHPMSSQQEAQPSIYRANAIEQQPTTLTPSQVADLTRYSSRSGIVSYPPVGYSSSKSPIPVDVSRGQNFHMPSGIDIDTSQSDFSHHVEMFQQEQQHTTIAMPQSQQQTTPSSAGAEEFTAEGFELLDNLFSVYLTSACAVPGGDCLCSDNCTCAGCTKHGNRFADSEGNGKDDLDVLSWPAQ